MLIARAKLQILIKIIWFENITSLNQPHSPLRVNVQYLTRIVCVSIHKIDSFPDYPPMRRKPMRAMTSGLTRTCSRCNNNNANGGHSNRYFFLHFFALHVGCSFSSSLYIHFFSLFKPKITWKWWRKVYCVSIERCVHVCLCVWLISSNFSLLSRSFGWNLHQNKSVAKTAHNTVVQCNRATWLNCINKTKYHTLTGQDYSIITAIFFPAIDASFESKSSIFPSFNFQIYIFLLRLRVS